MKDFALQFQRCFPYRNAPLLSSVDIDEITMWKKSGYLYVNINEENPRTLRVPLCEFVEQLKNLK